MGIFSNQDLSSMNDLFVQQLRDLYDAELRLTTALPKMADAATDPGLRDAFSMHLHETEEHVRRLESIFSRLGYEPDRQTCAAMKGLLKEGEEVIDADGDSAVKDAALIAAAQRVEHYEMAGYGSLRTFAQRLGMPDVAATLQHTLNEEGDADKKLTSLAESGINQAAAS